MNKRIGVLGSGQVGQTLAEGFARHGWDVMIGTNNASKKAALSAKLGTKVQVGSFEETAKFGNIVVLAVKGTGAEQAVTSAGVKNLKGKTVLDTTNPIAEKPPVNGVLQYFTTLDASLMERLQKIAPEADFVKAFSCVGAGLMVDPELGGLKPTMFICGNSEKAKTETRDILTEFGWETDDMGGVEAARAIEPLAILWCIPGFRENRWMHAFKMLKK